MVAPDEQSRPGRATPGSRSAPDAAGKQPPHTSGERPRDGLGQRPPAPVDAKPPAAAAEDPHEVAARALRRSLRHPFPVGFALGGLMALSAAVLVIQNGQSAQINWLWMDFSAPLWLVLVLTLVAGALIWETTKTAVRRGRRLRRERREALHRLRANEASS